MLFGNVNHFDKISYVDARLEQWVDEVKAMVAQGLTGKQQLATEGVFVMLVEADTEATAKRRAEYHKNYIDVQLVLKGEESIGYSYQLSDDLTAVTELENDVAFLDEVADENFVTLKDGDFAIFYPNEVHRPLCSVSQDMTVKKAILKIPAAQFAG